VLAVQVLPFAHFPQVPPPQSTSVSAPFFIPSVQVGTIAAQTPLAQLALWQSTRLLQVLPLAHLPRRPRRRSRRRSRPVLHAVVARRAPSAAQLCPHDVGPPQSVARWQSLRWRRTRCSRSCRPVGGVAAGLAVGALATGGRRRSRCRSRRRSSSRRRRWARRRRRRCSCRSAVAVGAAGLAVGAGRAGGRRSRVGLGPVLHAVAAGGRGRLADAARCRVARRSRSPPSQSLAERALGAGGAAAVDVGLGPVLHAVARRWARYRRRPGGRASTIARGAASTIAGGAASTTPRGGRRRCGRAPPAPLVVDEPQAAMPAENKPAAMIAAR
jgi:hypothetical protein